ncbi:hypothetical protein HGA64_02545, partial [Candidatus Falkowbacteria bacterium]|nr:hypothetical protein [Candidatus Falkowbacteria bacterium]
AFVDITGWVKDFDEAKVLAEIIKHEILIEVGEWLRCSVGISWTKFLAKFAGDTAPKGGCLAITPNNIDECLAIEVAAAWGIGRAMSRRLNELKIYTLFELKNFDPQVLRRRLGLPGYYLWCHVNGLEISQISSELVPPKSIGHSHCLPLKTTDKEYLLGVLYKLCDKTGRRLRQLDFEAATVYGQFACLYNSVHHISIKRSDKIFSTNDIFNPLADFLSKTALTVAVFKMSVGVTGLSRKSNQLDLFCRKDKQDKLSQTIDQINNRFGGYTITSGLMLGMEKTAPDQIAFRKI